MSETSRLNEKKVHCEAPNEGGEGSGGTLEGTQDDNDSSGDHGAAPVAENSSPSINFEPPSINIKPPSIDSESSSIHATVTSLSEENEQPAAAKGKQSDETIENLVALFRDFLEAAPNPATSNSTHTQQNTAARGRKRFFGLTKGSQAETGSNNSYDYEQKYPRDQFGEEAADNARVWLTYLDEAESFDRERVDGWKETADVLLVFAGLFSGVITTFVSQASQSLQQDNTRVSASLLFEITRLLRAQSSGTPLNNIPSSPLTPTSPFTPSTNAFLVNGLWFTSLAITLSTALFAVLAKQWLYYYLSSITGTAHEKVRARQLRFNGFELWNVGAIVDLLPILLHLAVGMFLTGIIILLFPLDIRVAWTIVIITGITYFLYFISVILPIRYPECPYTTSLTIYLGVLVFSIQTILRWISRTSAKGFQAVWRRINSQVCQTIRRLLQHTYSIFQYALLPVFKLAGVMCRVFGTLRVTLITEEFPKFTKWREENIKKAITNAAFLDYQALRWLYATSPNSSVHRIIARCVAVHPSIGQRFGLVRCNNLLRTLKVSETNVVDWRYGLCLGLRCAYLFFLHFGLCPDHPDISGGHWHLLWSITDVKESQLEEAEYRSYSRIAKNVLDGNYDQIMNDAINDDLKLPLAMWDIFFREVSVNATIAAHIFTPGHCCLFEWKSDPTRGSIHNTGVVSLDNRELGWWKFRYLYHYFFGGTNPDYSLDKTFETRYRLLITIYRNLTSNQPLIADKEQRQESLSLLFDNFSDWLNSSEPHPSSEQYFAFFIDICCADAFWVESMTDGGRVMAVKCLDTIWKSIDIDVANQFPFTECDDLSPIYQWCSRDLTRSLLWCTTPIFSLLLMPRNRDNLRTLLSRDPDAVSYLTSCFRNLGNCRSLHFARKYIYPNLMDLLKSVNPKVPLFNVLYKSSVLVQLWKALIFQRLDVKKFFLVVKSKLDQEKLIELYAAMTEQARSDRARGPNIELILWFRGRNDILDSLEVSAREFGQIIGVSHPQLESATEQSAPECVADKDHNTEERAQAPDTDMRAGLHSIANWTTKAFNSVWPKTSVK